MSVTDISTDITKLKRLKADLEELQSLEDEKAKLEKEVTVEKPYLTDPSHLDSFFRDKMRRLGEEKCDRMIGSFLVYTIVFSVIFSLIVGLVFLAIGSPEDFAGLISSSDETSSNTELGYEIFLFLIPFVAFFFTALITGIVLRKRKAQKLYEYIFYLTVEDVERM